jgi:hypothetical protein
VYQRRGKGIHSALMTRVEKSLTKDRRAVHFHAGSSSELMHITDIMRQCGEKKAKSQGYWGQIGLHNFRIAMIHVVRATWISEQPFTFLW